jgi:hypothetical protein
MKKVLLIVFAFIFSNSYSQTVSDSLPDSLRLWKRGGIATLNFSQVSLSNWAQGGENSVSATALLNLFANYKKGKFSWDNTFDATYGFLQTGNSLLRKSDDKLEFSSKYGYKTSKHWSIAALASFKSQMTQGYNYPNDSVMISDFLAPAYIMISTGMDYKPKDDFSFFFSPITGKITIVNNQTLADAGAYGVEKALFDTAGVQTAAGKKIRYEFGALTSFKFKQVIAKNITLSTKLDMFSNYFNNPQNIDVNWDLLLGFKVNKFVSASINTTLIYDHDIPVPIYHYINGVKTQTSSGPRTQFKEVLAIGFSYKF